MKKQLLLLLILAISINSYSQISFEKGYYVNNSNQKIDCLIKDIEWKNNPTEFEYKLSENSNPEKTTIESVKEFGINNTSKYIRVVVNIDRSSNNVNDLTTNKNPTFKEEKLFLKILVEGKATLYQYVENDLNRYFYNKDDANIEQLVFKKYQVSENQVSANNRYKQQLWTDLKCATFKMSKVENLAYKKNELVNFFIAYNTCNNTDFVSYQQKKKRDVFNLSVRPRLNSSSLSIQNDESNSRGNDFDNKLGFSFGVEAEFILPFNKNKWSVAIEPTYQSYTAEKSKNVGTISGGVLNSKVDYSSIEVPVSLRHYFFLNPGSKIFVNASYIFDFSSDSAIELTRNDGSVFDTLKIDARPNFAFGVGFKQSDTYSLELRYHSNRDLLKSHSSWKSDYKTMSLIFGYSFF